MKQYFRIVHSAMGYMPEISKDKVEWMEIAQRPLFEYNEAMTKLTQYKCRLNPPVVIYEDEIDVEVPQAAQE